MPVPQTPDGGPNYAKAQPAQAAAGSSSPAAQAPASTPAPAAADQSALMSQIQANLTAATAAPPASLAQPHPTSLAQDPAYLAFQRQIQNQQANIDTSTQDRVDAINRALAERVPALQAAGQQGFSNVAGQMDARGMLGSTQRDIAQARVLAATGQGVAGAQQTAADQIAALQQAAAAQKVALDTRNAELGLTAAGNFFSAGG